MRPQNSLKSGGKNTLTVREIQKHITVFSFFTILALTGVFLFLSFEILYAKNDVSSLQDEITLYLRTDDDEHDLSDEPPIGADHYVWFSHVSSLEKQQWSMTLPFDIELQHITFNMLIRSDDSGLTGYAPFMVSLIQKKGSDETLLASQFYKVQDNYDGLFPATEFDTEATLSQGEVLKLEIELLSGGSLGWVVEGANASRIVLSGEISNIKKSPFSKEIIISESAEGATAVYAADLDGDADLDVLSASEHDDKIAWYENKGNGTFSEQKIITTSADGADDVYAADIDNDGDMDVLSASSDPEAWLEDDKIAWYQNDGTGNFSTQKVISDSAYGASSVYTADIDNDGDLDVLSASRYDDTIAWYENDGTGGFDDPNIINASVDQASSIYAADIDNDNDMDVLFASWGDRYIGWHQNDGSGAFGEEIVITTSVNRPACVYANDLDNDGDMDVLSASIFDDKIAWYENDGNGVFSDQNVITTSALHAFSVYAADIDQDGDMDVLSASSEDNKISWYENNGSCEFSEQKIITTTANSAHSVYAADLDGDGDNDVLSASWKDNKIAWYKNLSSEMYINETQTSLMPGQFTLGHNYPNPFNPTTTIFFILPKACHVELNVYNVQGQKVATLLSAYRAAGSYQVEWNAQYEPSGVYIYRMQTETFVHSRKMVLVH